MKRLVPALLFLALAVPTSASALADLTGTGVTAPPMIFVGRTATFQFSLMNIGDAPATDFVYRLYLSDNRVITINDEQIYESAPMSIPVGGQVDVSIEVTVPTDVVPGDYYVGVVSNPTGTVDEPNLANNIKRTADPVKVRMPAPDLTVSEVRLPARAAAGENVPVTFTMENRGNEPATFRYGVYLSSNDLISTDDVLLYNRERTLDAGAQVIVTDYVRLAAGLPAGSYYLGLVMDPDNLVNELDEENNARASAQPIQVIKPALAILTSFLPQAVAGVPFDWRMSAIGGTGDYSWEVTDGALPDGLSLDSSSGEITGSPTTDGWRSFVIAVHSGSLTASTGYSMLVTKPTVSLLVQTAALPPALLQASYEQRLVATGGVPPYTWSVDGQLPQGLRLDASGVLSGGPRVIGAFDVTVQVQDTAGAISRAPLTLRVVDESMLTISTGLLPIGQIGQAYIAGFDVLGGQRPVTWSVVGGELPTGLTLEPDAGVLSGTPDQVGRFTFRLEVTDANGLTDTNGYSVMVVAQPVSIVETELDSAEVGEEYSKTFHVLPSSGQPPFVWAIESGDLPEGLSLDGDAGVISGTPADSSVGTHTFVLSVTDARGANGLRAYALEITDAARAAELAKDVPPPTGCASTRGGAGLGAILLLGAALLLGRRRRALAGLLALAALLPATPALAWNYTVASLDEPYQELSGGQVLNFSSKDDDYATVTLPFGFEFYGQTYNTLAVDTNGILTFGGASASYATNKSIPDPNVPNGYLAPWWDDLTGTNGNVTVQVQGTYPWRVFVVQYQNWARWHGGTLNFQVRLYESARKIKFSYGATGGSGTASSATVGIESPDGLSGVNGLACGSNCSESSWVPDSALVFSTDPDLVVSGAMAPTVLYGSNPAQLTATVANVGGEAAGPFDVVAYLSNDDVYDAGDRPMPGTFHVPGLDPGTSQDISFLATVPSDVTPGHAYWIFIVANPTGIVPEAQTVNNASQPVQVSIGPPTPNFRASVPTANVTTIAPGADLQVQFQITNSGNVGSDTGWELVLSTNDIISTDDLVIDQGQTTIDARAVASFTRTVTIPATLQEGVYRLGLIADPNNDVSEPDEVDNFSMMVAPLAVAAATVQIVSSTLPAGQVGRPYEARLDAAGGDGTYRWLLVEGSLPPGLTLDTTGALTGIPEEAGEYPLQLLVRSAGETDLGSVTVTVASYASPLTLVTEMLPSAVFGTEYGSQLIAVGGTPPYTWSIADGTLPEGVRLLDSGLLGGLPHEGGDFTFGVQVKDDAGDVVAGDLHLVVVEPANLTVTTLDLPAARLGADYQATVEAAGGTPPYRWSIEGAGRLPDGLSLDKEAGVISGTPTETGVFDVMVEVRDAREIIDTNTFTLTVTYDQGISIDTTTLPVATYDAPYEASLDVSGGTPDYAWSLVGGSLPPGLELDATGAIRGTPVGDQDGKISAFILQARDASGRTDIRGLSIRVQTAPPTAEVQGCSTASGSGGGGVLLLLLAFLFLPRRRGLVR